MTKHEFIKELKEALTGNVPARVVAENVDFYQNYIEGELRKGRSEADIMEELGSPRLIATTIIDTTVPEPEGYATFAEEPEEEKASPNFKIFHMSGWWLLLIPILILVLVVMLITHVIAALPSFVLWILVLAILYKWLRR